MVASPALVRPGALPGTYCGLRLTINRNSNRPRSASLNKGYPMFIGLLLSLLSGFCFGVCFVPVRYMNKFAWENIWFVYSLIGTAILPLLVGWATIPSMLGLYREIGWRMNLLVIAAGLLSGAGVVMYGLALVRIGMALVNALGNGISLVLGAFIPLLIQHREAIRGPLGAALLLGLAFAVPGVVICAVAASKREQDSAYMDAEHQKEHSHTQRAWVGVALAIGFGLLQPAMNFGLAFAGDYMKLASAHGTPEAFTSNAFYLPYLPPSLLSSGLYFAFLWKKNGTLVQFRGPNLLRYCLWCLLIAVIWFAGMILYGWAMPWMKSYGPVIGWPVLMASITIFSAVVEYFYGDWHGRALRMLSYGLFALTLAIAIFGYANWLIEKMA
jgi:L-rhamnose-H+ transport protein